MIGVYTGWPSGPGSKIDPGLAGGGLRGTPSAPRVSPATDMLGQPAHRQPGGRRTPAPAPATTTGVRWRAQGGLRRFRPMSGGSRAVTPFAVTASAAPQYHVARRRGADLDRVPVRGVKRFWRVTDARFGRPRPSAGPARSASGSGSAAPASGPRPSSPPTAARWSGRSTRRCTRPGCSTPGRRSVRPPPPRSGRSPRWCFRHPEHQRGAAADISAVVLNVTVTRPTTAGFLTVYPDGGSPPVTSNVNFVAERDGAEPGHRADDQRQVPVPQQRQRYGPRARRPAGLLRLVRRRHAAAHPDPGAGHPHRGRYTGRGQRPPAPGPSRAQCRWRPRRRSST